MASLACQRLEDTCRTGQVEIERHGAGAPGGSMRGHGNESLSMVLRVCGLEVLHWVLQRMIPVADHVN